MNRLLYEVTAVVQDRAAEDEWLRWMIENHLSDVVRSGAVRGRLVKLDNAPSTYLCQYEFASRTALDRYLSEHAPRLRAEGAAKFDPDQVAYSRRTGEILGDA